MTRIVLGGRVSSSMYDMSVREAFSHKARVACQPRCDRSPKYQQVWLRQVMSSAANGYKRTEEAHWLASTRKRAVSSRGQPFSSYSSPSHSSRAQFLDTASHTLGGSQNALRRVLCDRL